MRSTAWGSRAAWGAVLLSVGVWVAPAPLAAVSPPVPPAAAMFPATVHCGKLIRVERAPGALPWVEMDRVLAEGSFEAGTGGEDSVVPREPTSGMCFVVAVFELAPDRSLSKYDYRLDAGGKAYECVALRVEESPFDVRRWKVAAAGEAQMLFLVPAGQAVFHLVPALASSIPLRAVRDIVLAVPAAPVAAAVETPVAVPPPAASAARPGPAAGGAATLPAPAKPASTKRDALEF